MDLVPKVAHTCKYHGNATLVGCVYHFLVAHRATRVNPGNGTGIYPYVKPVSEREECIACDYRTAKA